MDKNKNIRIKDIAEMAGVSVGTVDRVIHDRGNVSAEAEQKVRQILSETDYTANPIAQSLGKSKDYHIAVMMPHPQQDKYWELAERGIDHARNEWESYNLHINLFPFDLYDADSFTTAAEAVLQAEPHAVMTVAMFYDQSLNLFRQLHQAEIPYLLFNTPIDARIKAYDPLGLIGPDLYQSGRLAAELMQMVAPEIKQVGILHIHENIESSMHLKEKERGFRDYFGEHASSPDIFTYSFVNDKESFESQIEQAVSKKKFEGIFVSTSSATAITAGVLKRLKKEQTYLIGFDLLEQNIRFLNDGIITFLINQNPRYQAFQGLRYLVNHLMLNKNTPSVDLLPLEIITKENCDSFQQNNDSTFI